MRATVTVEVDERGRFTIPEPARRALGIDAEPHDLTLEVRVLLPDDVAGNTADAEGTVDERGRITVKPANARNELGIRGLEATLEVTISPKDHRQGVV